MYVLPLFPPSMSFPPPLLPLVRALLLLCCCLLLFMMYMPSNAAGQAQNP